MTYDDAGNILSKTGVGHDFQYPLFRNRLVSYTSDGYEGKQWNAIEYTSFNKIKMTVGQAIDILETNRGNADGPLDSFLTKHLGVWEKGYTFVLALLNR
jgi:hypothetical protein